MAWGEYLTEEQDEDEFLSDSSDEEYHDAEQHNDEDEDEDEDDSDFERCHAPGTTSEKKRAQDEIFKAFAAKKIEQATVKELQESIDKEKDDKLSIQAILRKQENSTRITDVRDYQTELFQRASEENVIAVLDTGTGKTHIATLLLRHILDQELERRAKGASPKVAFFLVNSVNLVFQQMNVLQCGLEQKVEGVCGAMGVSLWRRERWEKLFAGNMVIVCTGAVLVECMMHSFVSIDDVSLLIFDEAHHAKSNHPYARIMKDYYHVMPPGSQRPRIFGMTASPVDSNVVDVQEAGRGLETLLDSKIATVSNKTLLANHINRPTEEIVFYARLKDVFQTPLHWEMEKRYGHIAMFKRFFANSKILGRELGSWASDAFWSFALSEEEGRKVEMRQERLSYKEGLDDVERLNQKIAQLKEAAEFVRSHAFRPPTATTQDLSSKVLMLRHLLAGYYERTGDARCIVFVERRQTARLLQMIFSHLGGPHLCGDILVGCTSRLAELNVSVRSQFMTTAKFRRGEVNCLFATSVGEEGLDIPHCNVVVRFDLYKTMISYVQSRGRARHRNSRFVHMLEKDNTQHVTDLHFVLRSEKVMRGFCSKLPSDRIVGEDEKDIAELLDNDKNFSNYVVPQTGAKLTYRLSIAVLAHFVACLPSSDREVGLQASYTVHSTGGKFCADVVLPECSPIISKTGKPCSRKAIARCSAAFEMCVELHQKGYLDNTLLPTYTKKLPAMRNALLAISSKSKDLYPMRIKPEFWDIGFDTLPDKFYLTVIDAMDGLDRPHQPIGLITRAPFPHMPVFSVYMVDGKASRIVSTPLHKPFSATEDNLRLLTTLTLQIYKDIFAKVFEYDEAKMSYWLVPLLPDKTASVMSADDPEKIIDWEQVHEIVEKDEYRWNPSMPHEFLGNKYIVDPNDGGRRFYSKGVVHHLKATDPVPDSAPRYKFMNNILDYSVSLWAKSRAKYADHWDRSQPVVEVEKIPFRRNFLAHVEVDEDEVKFNRLTYVCPEPLKISALTTRFVAMCYVFPAVIHRFEAYMVSIDATNRLDLKVGPSLALEALTKDSENSEKHGEVKVNFKSGMGPNYERLEFMGDCFLKMATSISTFVLQPNENEFEFHVRRMQMLCNKNLLEAALKYKLYEFVRSMAFSRRTWYPEGLKLMKGKGMKRNGPQVIKHQLGDKTVADVCEAFIGAAFMEHNQTGPWKPENWDQAVKAVKTLVDCEDHLMENWAAYYAAYEKPKYQIVDATEAQKELARQIEQKHPYHFKYPRLLRSAFAHPSQGFQWEQIPNYQRLEFLGDALLDQLFVTYLFYNYPDKDPQWLTEHKMPMVSNKFLGAICVRLGFHKHIRQFNSKLQTAINDYVVEVQDAEAEAKGAVDYWTTVSDPPKCLADVVEAFVAAMFVDSEFDFSVVKKFFDMHLKQFMADMTIYDHFAGNHPTTRLTKLLQDSFGCNEFRMKCMTQQETLIPGMEPQQICMIQIHWNVRFHGMSKSNRYARLKAAQAALDKLEGLAPYQFREMYGCTCKDETTVVDGEVEKHEVPAKVDGDKEGADGEKLDDGELTRELGDMTIAEALIA